MDLSSGNASNWLIRWICLQRLLTSFYFSLRDFIQPFAINKKRLRESIFFLRQIRRSDLSLTHETDKTTVTFVTYSTRGGVLKLFTMPMMWLVKCVRVVLVVNIIIHG